MSGNIGNYSTSMRSPIRTVYIGGTTSQSGGGGGTNYWTLSGNNIYNNNIGSVGINTSNPDISYNLDVSGSVRIRGDLLIDGSSTIIDTNILKVEDPLIQLGINNSADLKASGFYTEYRDVSNNKKYTGLVRPSQGTGYVLLNNSSTEPSDLYPDVSSVSTSYLSVERLGVNKPLSSLSSFYTDISGLTRIWTNRVLIGSNAGGVGQEADTIAIGNNAGSSNQGLNSIALGLNSAYYLQQPNALAIGRSAGAIAQGQNTVAIGYMAGEASQNTGALTLGYQAGRTFQGTNSIAIGVKAGEVNQGCNAIAIGNQAGQNTQCNNTIVLNASGTSLNPNEANGFYVDPIRNSTNNKAVYYNTVTKEITYSDISNGGIVSLPQGNVYGEYLLYNGSTWFVDGSTNVAIGNNAGKSNQGAGAIAIGFNAGISGEGINSIAIGTLAGACNQDASSIAIGVQAGQTNQHIGAIAIGTQAGQTNQGTYSIAIGFQAGRSNFPNNSIYINASTSIINPTTANALYISPIRNNISPASLIYPLFYDINSREVFYNNNVQLSGVNSGDSIEGMYGDGSDVTINFDGTYNEQSLYSTFNLAKNSYTLTRDIYPGNMTVFPGYTLETSGYRIFCTGTLINDGVIQNNGGNASGVTAGTGGAGGFFKAGGAGAAGIAILGAAAVGTAPPLPTNNTLVGNYGGRGACGRATLSTFLGSQGTIGATQVPLANSGGRKIACSTSAWVAPFQINNAGATYQLTPSMGGGSGAKSAVGTNAFSGGGGGGGGTMYIAAYNITGSGIFQCLGGNGGNAGGTGGNFGGGGGGAGGIIVVYTKKTTWDNVKNNFYVTGGAGGNSVALGATPTYSVARSNTSNGNGTTNTGLFGPSGVGNYFLSFTPIVNLSYNTLYILTVVTTCPNTQVYRPAITSVQNASLQFFGLPGAGTQDYEVGTTYCRMDVFYGILVSPPITPTAQDIMSDTTIRIQFDGYPATTYRAYLDEIQNVLLDENSVIVQSASTSTSSSVTTIANTLPTAPTPGNTVYTVVSRIAGTTPVAGPSNTLITTAQQAAQPFIISQQSNTATALQTNIQSWTGGTSAAIFSIEIAQPGAMESGTPGFEGRIIAFGQS